MRRALAITVLLLAGCGYSSVAGRMAPDLGPEVRFAPFIVRNQTPELSVTHTVTRALRSELGQLGLLGGGGERLVPEIQVRRIVDVPASYGAGRVIEYLGYLSMDVVVYDRLRSTPLLAGTQEIRYRYDYSRNPQVMQQLRMAALEQALRAWTSRFLLQVSTALELPAAVPVSAEAVTGPTPRPVTAPADSSPLTPPGSPFEGPDLPPIDPRGAP